MIPLDPSDELLAAWLAGDLADPEDAAVTAAVAGDPAVAARADGLADLLTALAVAGTPPPPASLADHLDPAVLAGLAATRETADATAPLIPAATVHLAANDLAIGAGIAAAAAAGRGPRAGRPPAGPGAVGGPAGTGGRRQRRMQQWLSGLAAVALLAGTAAVVVRTRGEGFGTDGVATEVAEADATEAGTSGDVRAPSETLEAVTGEDTGSPSPRPSPSVLAVPTPSVSPTPPAAPPSALPAPTAPAPPAPAPALPPPDPAPPPAPAPAPPPPPPAPATPSPTPAGGTDSDEEGQPQPGVPGTQTFGPTPSPQPQPSGEPSPSEGPAGEEPVDSGSTPDPAEGSGGPQPPGGAPQTAPTIRDAMADLPDSVAVRSYFGGRPGAEQLLGLQEEEAEERADQHAASVRGAPDFASGTAPAACLDAALAGQPTAVIAAVESVVYDGVEGIGYLVVRGAPQLSAIDVTVFDLACAPLAREQL